MSNPRKIEVAGVPITFGIDQDYVLNKLEGSVGDGGSHTIFTVNPEFIMKAKDDPEFLKVLVDSDLNVADGAGIIFAKN